MSERRTTSTDGAGRASSVRGTLGTLRRQGARRAGAATVGWLALPFAAGGAIAAAYLLGTAFPGNYGGLFLTMAERVGVADYRLPATVPGYTRGGLPFAYPPLAFYVLAALRDLTGASLLTLARYLPPAVALAYLAPVLALGVELTGSVRRASLATTVVAVSPEVFAWNVSAGGVVRAPAFLFTAVGLYAGLRLFRDGELRWGAAGAVCFGLVVLTHPVYAAFYAVSYLFLYGALDRSLRGLLAGAGVAAGGLVLTIPWLFAVVRVHGLEVFANAAGTRGGLFPVPTAGVGKFLEDIRTEYVTLWHALIVLGLGWLVARGRYLLPGWFAAVLVALPRPRYFVLVGSFAVAAYVLGSFAPELARSAADRWPVERRHVVAGVVCAFALFGVLTGALYAAGYPVTGPAETGTTSAVSPQDRAAMSWVERETPAAATFAVAGRPYEWFPFLADRTMVVSPLGAEWLGSEVYLYHEAVATDLADCESPDCYDAVLAESRFEADYLYVSRDGRSDRRWRILSRQFRGSERFRVAYRNDGAVVAERTATAGPTGTRASTGS